MADQVDNAEKHETYYNPAEAPKITDWANEPTAARLQEDWESAKPSHDLFAQKIDKWNALSEVTGSAKPPKLKGRSQVQPKLIRRQAEWRYSALTEPFNSSEEMFKVSPTTWEDGDAARQNQLVLNWQFRTKIKRVNFIDDYIRANVDEGTAVVRVGWNRVTTQVEEEVPVWSYMQPTAEEEIEQLQAAIQLKVENPRAFNEDVDPAIQAAVEFFEETNQPSIAIQTGTEIVQTDKVVVNQPTVEVVNPKNLWFDPTCGNDLSKAGFVVYSFETSQAELAKEPNRYKNLNHINWEGASPVADPDHNPQSTDINFNFKDPLRKKVVAYEYWGMYDIHNNGKLVPIVATWIGNVMIRMEENPFPDGKPPFVVVVYMPVKRQLMGEPDAELLEENQKILGAVSRGMIDLLGRSANAQQGHAKGFLDVLNKRRYESGQDYEFNPNIQPGMGVVEHKYPEIPQSALVMVQMQNQEAEALTGVKAFSGGLSGDAYGDVATGIKGILDAASKREMAILRRLANGLVEIGKKIISMNAEFLSEQEVIRITNTEFVTVNREDLSSVAGEFDLIVDISTAEIDNNKSQDLAFMLQTMGNNMDFGITKMILIQIARLKRMTELVHQIEAYEPQPDPLLEKAKELEIMKLEMEIEKLRSEVVKNQAIAMKHQVEAEQGALDTVEQESGTKHARDMEKQVAQSTGNQSLEVTKSLLKPRKLADGVETRPEIEAAVGFNEMTKQMRDPIRTTNPPVLSL